MRFLHRSIGIQPRIMHDAIDKIIRHCCDSKNTAEPFIKTWVLSLS